MKIAVVIPAFNGERYVADCIASLQAETHSDWEAYVMDDGSSDGTLAAVQSFAAADPRIHVWRQENRGLVATMNALLDKIDDSADFMAFLDIDDFIHPRMFEILLEAAERTGSDVAECSIAHVPQTAHPADAFPPLPAGIHERLIDDMSIYWVRRTSPGGWINKQNKLYRRASIDGLRFRPTLSYEDDLFFACEVNARIRRKVKLDADLYAYRANPASATAVVPMRKYVGATLERIRLSCEVFLRSGLVPAKFVPEFKADLAKDAYRMCIRKNLRRNRDAALRKELFLEAGKAFAVLERDWGFSPTGLNPVQAMIYRACLRGRYGVASLLVALT